MRKGKIVTQYVPNTESFLFNYILNLSFFAFLAPRKVTHAANIKWFAATVIDIAKVISKELI